MKAVVLTLFGIEFFTKRSAINESKEFGLSSSEMLEGPRGLSINLGNGTCEWTLPTYDIPEDIDFYKTIIVGFPSGDKRLTFVQMESLTGWAAKDEWDFEYLGE